MFGSSQSRLLVAAAAACLIPSALLPAASAQQDQAPVANAQNQGEVHPMLGQLLEAWSRNSAQIEKLRGEHTRYVYDYTFEVERSAKGRFYYEKPDKGRIDLAPTEITRQMIRDRETGKVPSKKGKSGKPFKLQQDQPERWICDGEKVFDIDDDKLEAIVLELPPQDQGENIMNTPLPFLFGLPPKQAVARFDLDFTPDRDGKPQIFKQGDRYAHIRATPKQRKDQATWKMADIILDTRTFLPSAIRLINPAGTEETSYVFTDLKMNGFTIVDWWQDPFKPNLSKHNVHVMQPGQGGPAPTIDSNPPPRQAQATPPRKDVVPELKGLLYTDAKNQLRALGVAETDIKFYSGGEPTAAADALRVKNQIPKPGSPLKRGEKIALQVWEKTATQ